MPGGTQSFGKSLFLKDFWEAYDLWAGRKGLILKLFGAFGAVRSLRSQAERGQELGLHWNQDRCHGGALHGHHTWRGAVHLCDPQTPTTSQFPQHPSLPLVVSLSRMRKVPLGFPKDNSCRSASFRPSFPKYHLHVGAQEGKWSSGAIIQ